MPVMLPQAAPVQYATLCNLVDVEIFFTLAVQNQLIKNPTTTIPTYTLSVRKTTLTDIKKTCINAVAKSDFILKL